MFCEGRLVQKKTYNYQTNVSIFRHFFMKKQAKTDLKNIKIAVCNKSWWKHGPWDHFLGQGLIFGGFLDPAGDPKMTQNRTLGLKIRIQLARGVPREPQEPILVDFWTILESFWVPRWTSWDLPGTLLAATSSKQQQRWANSDKERKTPAKNSK